MLCRLSRPTSTGPCSAGRVCPLNPVFSAYTHLHPTDAGPFKAMAAVAREAYSSRNTPPKATLAPPSDLRKLVAEARASVLDPVLASFRLPADLALLSDDEPDPEELRRAREREKIRELKKRRIEGDADASVYAGLGLRRPTATQGVFIRQDQEDESAEVDISLDDGGAGARRARGSTLETTPMEVDAPPASSSPFPASVPLPAMSADTGKERRAPRKAQTEAKAKTSSARTKNTVKVKAQPKPKPETRGDSSEPATGPPRDKNGKAKSDTYKQAWSVSEQHLLERLLEEIPEGEKNRCVDLLPLCVTAADPAWQVVQNIEGHERAADSQTGRKPCPKVLRKTKTVRGGGREQQGGRMTRSWTSFMLYSDV